MKNKLRMLWIAAAVIALTGVHYLLQMSPCGSSRFVPPALLPPDQLQNFVYQSLMEENRPMRTSRSPRRTRSYFRDFAQIWPFSTRTSTAT